MSLKYIFYVNVGPLSKLKADLYIRNVMEECAKHFFEPDDKVCWIPIRNKDSYIHVFNPETGAGINVGAFSGEELDYLNEIDNYLKVTE
jgi:hypothetical protein